MVLAPGRLTRQRQGKQPASDFLRLADSFFQRGFGHGEFALKFGALAYFLLQRPIDFGQVVG